MAGARRATVSGNDGDVAEVGGSSPARRASESATRRNVPRGATVRRILAPLTFLSVVGLAAAAMALPGTEAGLELTDPSLAASSPFGVSRNYARPSLTASESPSPSASSASASPSVAVSQTPSATPSAIPSPTAAAVAATTEAPAPVETPSPEPVDYTVLRDAAGTRYTTAGVNLRVGPGKDYDARTTLSEGKAVEITEWAVDGWRQVVWSEKSGWIKESFLTETKPVVAAAPSKAAAASGGSSSGFSTEACAAASGIESGLTSRTRAVLRAVCAEFPSVTSYGGYRAGGGSYHSSGQAIDVMVSGEAGWEIARWARANASSLGIIEVLYSQQIWTAQRSGDGWRGVEDRGSVSANHYDHVHISVG